MHVNKETMQNPADIADISALVAADVGLSFLDHWLPREDYYLRSPPGTQYGWGDAHPALVPLMTEYGDRFATHGGEALWLLLHCNAFFRDAGVGAHAKDDRGLSSDLDETKRAMAILTRLWQVSETEEADAMTTVLHLGIVEPCVSGDIPEVFMPYLVQFEARFGALAPTLLATYAGQLRKPLSQGVPVVPLLCDLYAWASAYPLDRYPALAGEVARRATDMVMRNVPQGASDRVLKILWSYGAANGLNAQQELRWGLAKRCPLCLRNVTVLVSAILKSEFVIWFENLPLWRKALIFGGGWDHNFGDADPRSCAVVLARRGTIWQKPRRNTRGFPCLTINSTNRGRLGATSMAVSMARR